MTTTKTPQVLTTLLTFDSGGAGELRLTEPFANIPLKAVGKLTTEQYIPHGGTPLRDATAAAISKLDSAFQERPDDIHIGFLLDASGSMGWLQQTVVDGYNQFIADTSAVEPTGEGRVMLITFTDGGENASREITSEALRKLTEAREESGWTFVYMGANQNAYATANTSGLSVRRGSYMSTSGTAKGMSSSMSNLSLRSSSFVGEGKDQYDVMAAAMGDTLDEDGNTGAAAPEASPTQPKVDTDYDAGRTQASDFLKGS